MNGLEPARRGPGLRVTALAAFTWTCLAACSTGAGTGDVPGDLGGSDASDIDPACVPSCQGKTCGFDGCGGTCGTCQGGTVCNGASCIEDPCPAGFALVPAATFTAGSPASEPGREAGGGDETAHVVQVSRAFCMGTTEVTQGEWTRVTGRNPAYFAGCGENCPVEGINWYDAIAFCNALSTQEGLTPCYQVGGESGTFGGGCVKGQVQCSGDFRYESVAWTGTGCTGYRLPTEAEWELAARAGTMSATGEGTVDGDHLDCQSPNPVLDGVAWYCGNADASYPDAYDCAAWSPLPRCGPQPVGGKGPNALGLHDMLGNVFEFCWDWYSDYADQEVVDPAGPATGYNRVMRGGAWDSSARFVRFAARVGMNPGDRGDAGLRLVRAPAAGGGAR